MPELASLPLNPTDRQLAIHYATMAIAYQRHCAYLIEAYDEMHGCYLAILRQLEMKVGSAWVQRAILVVLAVLTTVITVDVVRR